MFKNQARGGRISVQMEELDSGMSMDTLSMVMGRRTEYMRQSCVCMCVRGGRNLWCFLAIANFFFKEMGIKILAANENGRSLKKRGEVLSR